MHRCAWARFPLLIWLVQLDHCELASLSDYSTGEVTSYYRVKMLILPNYLFPPVVGFKIFYNIIIQISKCVCCRRWLFYENSKLSKVLTFRHSFLLSLNTSPLSLISSSFLSRPLPLSSSHFFPHPLPLSHSSISLSLLPSFLSSLFHFLFLNTLTGAGRSQVCDKS